MMPTVSLYQLPATELPKISTLSTMGDILSVDKHRNPQVSDLMHRPLHWPSPDGTLSCNHNP